MYAPSLHEGRGSAAADRTVGASHENLDHGDGGSDPKKGADGGGFSRGVSSRSCNLPAPAPHQSVTALVGERAESARGPNSLRDRSIERRRRGIGRAAARARFVFFGLRSRENQLQGGILYFDARDHCARPRLVMRAWVRHRHGEDPMCLSRLAQSAFVAEAV